MKLEVPDDLAELFQNPAQVRYAFQMLKALREISVIMTTAGNAPTLTSGAQTIQGDPPKLQMILPIKLASSIANPTGGATVDTQARAAIISLLTMLRTTGQLPI